MAKKKTEKQVEKKAANARKEPFTSELRVPLKANEIADRADRAAQLEDDIEQKQTAQKADAKVARSALAQMSAEKRRLQSEVRTKATYREVQCERRFLYDAGVVVEVRLDTDEELSNRPMTETEKQQFLPFDSGDQSSNRAGQGSLDEEFGGEGAGE